MNMIVLSIERTAAAPLPRSRHGDGGERTNFMQIHAAANYMSVRPSGVPLKAAVGHYIASTAALARV